MAKEHENLINKDNIYCTIHKSSQADKQICILKFTYNIFPTESNI